MDERFNELCAILEDCAKYAKREQKGIDRRYKDDGTVLTKVDLGITEILIKEITRIFPSSNIITEERLAQPFSFDKEYTFIFDPIDGTDLFSQGLCTWCIGLGVLDKNLHPVGSYVYAPCFLVSGEPLVLRSDPSWDYVTLNGEIVNKVKDGEKDIPKEISIGSGLLNTMDFRGMKLHYRCYGSSVLHITSALVFPQIEGCIDPRCYIWDIAAPHAAAIKLGMDYQYINGDKFIYDEDLRINRKRFKMPVLIGTKGFREFFISKFKDQTEW